MSKILGVSVVGDGDVGHTYAETFQLAATSIVSHPPADCPLLMESVIDILRWTEHWRGPTGRLSTRRHGERQGGVQVEAIPPRDDSWTVENFTGLPPTVAYPEGPRVRHPPVPKYDTTLFECFQNF